MTAADLHEMEEQDFSDMLSSMRLDDEEEARFRSLLVADAESVSAANSAHEEARQEAAQQNESDEDQTPGDV
eukprot:COSAG05_NODE_74_length_21769_cov_194.316290_26_plen_72_part_00